MNFLVVARHQEDVGWLDKLPAGWTPMVVEKGTDVPNMGREATSYLWAIEMLYDRLVDFDIVAFVQGDPFDHCSDLIEKLEAISRQYLQGSYKDLGDDERVTFGDGSSDHPGIPVRAAYEKWTGNKWPGNVRFSPGAQFATTGAKIKRQPVSWYRQLAEVVSEGAGPWVIERLWRTLFLGDDRPAVEPLATFYHAATPGTTYLRCELPARHLPGELTAHIRYADSPVEDMIVFPDHLGDSAIMQLAADKQRAAVMHHMQHQGIRVLVETDDNYRTISEKAIRKRTGWGIKIGDDAHTLGGHEYICKHADGVIVTTDYLANQYRKVNPNVYVCPNTVDPEDWPESAEPDETLSICWFASLSHTGDIPLVSKALEWASRQKGVEVYCVGLNPRWNFRYYQVPWIDSLHHYRAAFRHFDVGVAPVKADPFGLGRSDIKFLEYSMGGCASVVSDCAPYKDVPGELCHKAKDAKGFLKAIQHLVRNRDEARQLGVAAREYVLANRTTAAQIHLWKQAINS